MAFEANAIAINAVASAIEAYATVTAANATASAATQIRQNCRLRLASGCRCCKRLAWVSEHGAQEFWLVEGDCTTTIKSPALVQRLQQEKVREIVSAHELFDDLAGSESTHAIYNDMRHAIDEVLPGVKVVSVPVS